MSRDASRWSEPRAHVAAVEDEGGCMFDGHVDAYGHSDHRRVVVFHLGNFRARVCLPHAAQLRSELGECIRPSR